MKQALKFFLTLNLLFSQLSFAATGELELRNWVNATGTTKVPVMKLRYNLSTYFQEPCEKYNFYYESIDDFNKIAAITIRAQVTAGGVAQDAYIEYGPLVEDPGKWGWDVTGCGYWNTFFKSDSGGPISEAAAKGFYKAGIGLVNLEVVEILAEQYVDNDRDYQSFLNIVGDVYTIETSWGGGFIGESPADSRLPRSFKGGSKNNFWDQRLISPANAREWNWLTDQLTTSGTCDRYLDKFQWTYGGYEHVALRQSSGNHYLLEDKQMDVRIIVQYRGLGSKKGKPVIRSLGSHRFRTKLGNGEGFVVVDRIRNPGGQPLQVSVHMDCIKPGEEEQDPLAKVTEPDPLEELLNQETAKRYDVEAARQEKRVDAVYKDNAEAKARREEEKRRREEWLEWINSDEYKEQQRLKREAEEQRRQVDEKRRLTEEKQRQLADKKRRQDELTQALIADEIARGDQLEVCGTYNNYLYCDKATGKAKIKRLFESASKFSEGRAWVKVSYREKYALIDPDGNKILSNVETYFGDFQSGLALYQKHKDSRECHIADRSGRELAGPFYRCYNGDWGLKTNGYILVQEREDGPWSLYDRNARKVYTFSEKGRPTAHNNDLGFQTRTEYVSGKKCSHKTERIYYKAYDYSGNYLGERNYTELTETPCIRLRSDR